MGRFLKALVMTLLLMEITAIVALTAVWTVLSELHASQSILFAAPGLTAAGLSVLALIVFRRALHAERLLESEPDIETVTSWQGAVLDMPGPNAVGPATSPALSGDPFLVRHQPAVHRVE
jgi:hypothetical protein